MYGRRLRAWLLRFQVHNTLRVTVTPWKQQLRFYADYPDHVKVQLPALSPTMETGTIISWHKKEGKMDGSLCLVDAMRIFNVPIWLQVIS